MKKIIYFSDFMGDQEQEWKDIKNILENNDVDLSNSTIELTTRLLDDDCVFDILFFDYGGLSCGFGFSGDKMQNHYTDCIIKDANEHPNRLYVITSQFTKEAIDDFIRDAGIEEIPKNIILDIEDNIELIKIFLEN